MTLFLDPKQQNPNSHNFTLSTTVKLSNLRSTFFHQLFSVPLHVIDTELL